MKNTSKSLQQLRETSLHTPDPLGNCNINVEGFLEEAIAATKPAPQCDIHDRLRLQTEFWYLWQQYQDYNYNRCLQWMGGNTNDAEDSLSRAMLKAWKKWPDYAGKIKNPKAWLTRLIHNLCMDIHRKRKRSEQGIENIEEIKVADNQILTSSVESPESDICRREMKAYLHHTIVALPPRLRDAFILRYCHQKSYRHIAKQLVISEENVYKRVQQARRILKKQLNKYLAGEDDTSFNCRYSWKWAIASAKESKSDETAISDSEVAMASLRDAPRSLLLHRSTPAAGIATPSIVNQINYKVTALCLKTLPHSWYSSLNPLGWR
ncbi:MAG: sigma-70 family RNA polymerase sigma factor [Nostoc sp. ChiSLP02]|nr:sigma-70 family RNA polymerase sigma factor [Nostoc sp. DedSLP05]MDZ8103359.1 sigma-70 family RNA polymerase sigma factor [Nostoc sp. DedSLP01]MDZ8189408.1 sigma-70 family RNA polymerase sigma factor [Nostoc sp. ChiSLP02]